VPALLLAAATAASASGATVAPAASARVQSLKVAPHQVHVGRSTLVTWELSSHATTTFVVKRCLDSKCTRSTAVGSPIRRRGSAGLNTFRLTAKGLSTARYKLVAKTAANSRHTFFTVIK
jgi:hypothetical protein